MFHGKGDNDEPEWPPSPLRFFQALLAGSRTGCRNREWSDAKADAFRWLEQRKPPLILAPATHQASVYTLFVPNNDSDKKFDRQERLTSKIVQPHHLMNGDRLHYLWAIEESDWPSVQRHAELLCCETHHLMTLGWGIDQAVGDGRILTDVEATALLGQRWQPWIGHWPGRQTYRVPMDGSLSDLEYVHETFLDRVNGKQYRPSSKPTKFNTVTYIRKTTLPPRPYAVFELTEGNSFRQVNAVKVAAMLRSLTCKLAKEDTFEFPGGSEHYVAGHLIGDNSNPARFSYLPLPTIGHKHADGMIRRLLIAEPFGGDSSCAAWAQNRLRNATVIDEDGNERGILLDLWREGSREMIRRYIGESHTWCSVTPVILPGYDDFGSAGQLDKERPTKAERLFFKCLTHAGIPIESVAEVIMRRAPFFPGSQHPQNYHRPDYLKDHRSRPGWHVRIVFTEPISGPLAIGAGRYCGLGVFAKKDE